MFETEKRHVESRKCGGQRLGERKANSGGPFINFLELFFLVLTEISQGKGSKKLWGCAEWLVCPH